MVNLIIAGDSYPHLQRTQMNKVINLLHDFFVIAVITTILSSLIAGISYLIWYICS